MIVRPRYKRKLFLYFFVVFLIFTIVIGGFQYDREKRYKIEQLENTLDIYSGLIRNFIDENGILANGQFSRLDSMDVILPDHNIRITVIDLKGKVLFDSFVDDYASLENHKDRPEIQKALYSDSGSNIRLSASTGKDYYYYAKLYGDYFVRTAMVYDIQGQALLKPDKLFILVILVLFVFMWASLAYVADKFGKSVSALSDFALEVNKKGKLDKEIQFPNNEIGVISRQIAHIFDDLQEAKNAIQNEKDKLVNHIHVSQEGIAFFTLEKKKIMANNHFIQYINTISEKLTLSLDNIFDIEELQPINEFIEVNQKNGGIEYSGDLPVLKFEVSAGGKYFSVQCICFQDGSFEISINDITKLEKRKQLKQEMTNSIAQELQTPVNAIKGILDNLSSDNELSKEEYNKYILKVKKELKRIDKLTRDTSILAKIEEAGSLYPVKKVNLQQIVNEAVSTQQAGIEGNGIHVQMDIPDDTVIKGNKFLLEAIFQNLLENTIQYAGSNVDVEIKMYLEDKYNYNFMYSDSGKGIPEEYLPRIFERFYQIDRENQEEYEGSGLGLAIVKNAVEFHKGKISAKNRKKGGMEFVFSLSKK